MMTIPYLLLLVATGAAASQEPPEEPAVQAATAPASEPWDGTFAEGLDEVARLATERAHDEALSVADALLVPTRFARWRADLERSTHGWSERALGLLDRPLTWFGLEPRTSADRGEIHYAKGLVHATTGAVQEADEAFELARVLAGPGRTRLDAMYDLGAIDLAAGEVFRAQIPELQAAMGGGAGQPAQPPLATIAPEDEAPDPLELARAAYLAAREHFIERLRADWRDADTRADVELVMRRLRELDEIEEQREEEEQEARDQQDQDQQQSEDGDPSDAGDEQDQEQDGEQQEGENEDQDEQEREEEPPEDPEPGEDEESEEAQAPEPEERILTQEEVKRLLEQLEKLDKEGEELRARLRGVRRQAVDRDW